MSPNPDLAIHDLYAEQATGWYTAIYARRPRSAS